MAKVTDLPLELLAHVALCAGGRHSLSGLLRTCRTLHRYAEYFLFSQQRRKRVLLHAIEHDNADVFDKFLAKHGTRATQEHVLQACRFGRLDLLKKLVAHPGGRLSLETFPDDAPYTVQLSPLYVASRYGQADVVEYLLSLPTTGVNAQSGVDRFTALHGAISSKCDKRQVIALLVAAGADPAIFSKDRVTPLQLAIIRQDVDGLRLLLEAGFDPEGGASCQPLLAAIKASTKAFEMSEILLMHGATASGRTEQQEKPLACAASRGRDRLVALLLEHGADIRTASKHRQSGLRSVLMSCSLETCKMFVARGGILAAAQTTVQTLQRAAAMSGDAAKLRWVLDDDDLFARMPDKKRPKQKQMSTLLCCARSRQVVELLIERGADPNVVVDGKTPFEIILADATVFKTTKLDILRALLENGADMSQKQDKLYHIFIEITKTFQRDVLAPVFLEAGLELDADQKQKLLFDCVTGFERNRIALPFIKFMVDWGANINAVDYRGQSLLFIAMRRFHYSSLDLFISLGANVHTVGPGGNTLLHTIMMEKAGKEVHAARRLLELGLDPNATNFRGYSAVDVALQFGSQELIELYLAHGAEVTAVRAVGDVWASSVHLSTTFYHKHALKAFVKHGVDLNVRDKKQRTPLHWAKSHGDNHQAKLLIRAGADVFAEDENGNMAGKVRTRLYSDLFGNLVDVGDHYRP